jgi:hypothetical protein
VSKPDYPTWIASKLPDVTFAPDAGGVWRYWEVLQVGEEKRDGDEYFNGVSWTRTLAIGYVVGKLQYRRPIPRPTERLLEAMKDPKNVPFFVHPLQKRWSRLPTTAIDWMAECEHSYQAEPGDGGGTPLSRIMGKWPGDETDEEITAALAALDDGESGELAAARQAITSLQQQVAGLTEERDGFDKASSYWYVAYMVAKGKKVAPVVSDPAKVRELVEMAADRQSLVDRATIAEFERDEARKLLSDAVRNAPAWCARAAGYLAALSPAESGVRE